jgi:hypothetical protein
MPAPTRIAAAAWRGRMRQPWRRGGGAAGVIGPSSRAARLALLGALLAAASCTDENPARAGADRFVDSYYVEIDLPRARENAVGLARAKVEREIELLKGVEGPESDAKPTVYYRLLEERGGDRPGFVYELTISFGGGETVKRRTLVIVREEAGTWRAVNFEELD